MEIEKLLHTVSIPVRNRPSAFMGFDGFIDTVARLSPAAGRRFGSMSDFGAYLSERRERNCSLEINPRARRLGGNMPNCANALAALGVPVACVGAVGAGAPDPAFAAMHPLCSLYPVAQPGQCLALEFADSKLFLADMAGPSGMSWEGILEAVGRKKLMELASGADLLGLFNWGELHNMHGIWKGFARDILPALRGKCRIAVFDLADCSGRSTAEIRAVLSVLHSFKPHAHVVLSVNNNELAAAASALGCSFEDYMEAGTAVFETGSMDMLVHHSLGYARVFGTDGFATAEGARVGAPAIATGGGDHFNAGFCLGLLSGLGGAECAELGNAVSRLYVSAGESPSFSDVIGEFAPHNEILQEERA